MTNNIINLVVHSLALAAGVISILIANAVYLGISPFISGILAVVILILFYISNQLPNLGSGTGDLGSPTPNMRTTYTYSAGNDSTTVNIPESTTLLK